MPTEEREETSHCTSRGYCVEARVRPDLIVMPVQAGAMILDERWRRVRFKEAPIGVPSRLYCAEMKARNYLTYEAAMALAYWFLSSVDAMSVQVRLVEYKGVVDCRITRAKEHEPIGNYAFVEQEGLLRRTESPQADDAVARSASNQAEPTTRD